MLRGAPSAGTWFPCLVPPPLPRAASCSSSVQLPLWALFSIVLLCSTGSGGLLCHRASQPGMGLSTSPQLCRVPPNGAGSAVLPPAPGWPAVELKEAWKSNQCVGRAFWADQLHQAFHRGVTLVSQSV